MGIAQKLAELGGRINKLDFVTKNLVSIGVDVHFKEPHMILIYSRLGGGQLREIRVHFKDLRELEDLVRELKARYATDYVIIDALPTMGSCFREW